MLCSGRCLLRRATFDRRPNQIPPLSPGAVIIDDVFVAEQILQHEPGTSRFVSGDAFFDVGGRERTGEIFREGKSNVSSAPPILHRGVAKLFRWRLQSRFRRGDGRPTSRRASPSALTAEKAVSQGISSKLPMAGWVARWRVVEPELPFHFQRANAIPGEGGLAGCPSRPLRVGAEGRPVAKSWRRKRQQDSQSRVRGSHRASGSASPQPW
jgi:hypothetical protein